MRHVLLVLMLAAAPAWAQAPLLPSTAPKPGTCADCGAVFSVRAITRETSPPPVESTKPSGFVASIPLGAGSSKPSVGSSTKVGKDAVPTITRWEVVVRFDDGRFTMVMLDDEPDLREGDKVRVEKGQVVRRSD